MKILITGSNGFIAKNFISELNNIIQKKTVNYNKLPEIKILEYTRNNSIDDLSIFCKEADIVFHLAGINRPKNSEEFIEGNINFTKILLDKLIENNNLCPIIFTSSIQAENDSDYGVSKKYAEEIIIKYKELTNTNVFIYRLPNVFGKWCKPNYNSVIATFCYNLSRNIPIIVNNRNIKLNFVYIDDIVKEFVDLLINFQDKRNTSFYEIKESYKVSLGYVVELLTKFKDSRSSLELPNINDLFEKKLYATYLSYLPENNFNYSLTTHSDIRGSFSEFIKTDLHGQISINISKPKVVKGNHWHHTKIEKFLVVSGNGVIRLRNLNDTNIIEYFVSGEKLEVIDIPVGYVHNIENLGDIDMVTIMWANEIFDPNNPDTYYMEV